MTSLITVAVIVVIVVPLCLFTGLVGQQARRSPVRPAWYWCLAVSWLGGAVVAIGGLAVVENYLARWDQVSAWLELPLLFLVGAVGGSVGPGLIYAYLRLRRTHDPDYGPLHSEAPD